MSNAVPEQAIEQIQWRRVNAEPFEYAIQQGPHGDEFVKLIDGSCLRRALPLVGVQREDVARALADAKFVDHTLHYILSAWAEPFDEDVSPAITASAERAATKFIEELASTLALPHTGQPQTNSKWAAGYAAGKASLQAELDWYRARAEGVGVTFCYVTYRACTASCPTREECALRTAPQIADQRLEVK